MSPSTPPQSTNTPEPTLEPTPPPAAVTVSSDDATLEPKPIISSTSLIAKAKRDSEHDSKRPLFIGCVVLLLALMGLGALLIASNSKNDTKVVAAPKKDITDLRVALFQPLAHDYYPNIPGDTTSYDVNIQLFEGLTKFVNGTTLQPGLADSWTNPDASTWVFKLHPNVKFHTNRILSAQDVKVSLDTATTTDYGKLYSSTIKAVTVIDPLTVKITTDGTDPLLTSELANLFIYDSASTKKNDAINGTGPYNLASESDSDIKLVAFDGYHGGHIYTRQVDYLYYNNLSDVPSNDVQSKKIQIINLAGNNDTITHSESLLKNVGYVLADAQPYNIGHLVINTLRPGSPLTNLKVRHALANALDIPKLSQVLNSAGFKVAPAYQIIAKGIPGYNPTLKTNFQSSSVVKDQLSAAGYPNGFSFILSFRDSPRNQVLGSEVAKQLAEVGVIVKLDPETDLAKLEDNALHGKTDMYSNILGSNLVDGSDILSDFINSDNYNNPALKALNLKASQDSNPKSRVEILQQMAKIIHDDQADLPLYVDLSNSLATAPNIIATPGEISSYPGIYFWQVYAK